jgi:hypothetical protein
VFEKLIYELQSIATNFRQLADATGNEGYIKWARYIGGQLVEKLIGRTDLTEVMEAQLEPLNGAGHAINGLARKANSGSDIEAEERAFAIQSIKLALKPLEDALSDGNR